MVHAVQFIGLTPVIHIPRYKFSLQPSATYELNSLGIICFTSSDQHIGLTPEFSEFN